MLTKKKNISSLYLQSFFGRACNKSQSIPECKKNSKCVINKNTRTTCKACRLTKCIQVGMSKGGSKFGRRSNWFKINFLLEEKQKASMKMNSEMKTLAENNLFTQAAAMFPKQFPIQHHHHQLQQKQLQQQQQQQLKQQQQPSPSSTSSSNSLDLTSQMSQYSKLPPPNHELSFPFYSAAMQYPFHPAMLQTAMERLSAMYRNQNYLQPQRNESMSSNDDTDSDEASNGGSGGGGVGGGIGVVSNAQRHTATVSNLRMSASPTPSSSSSSSIAVPSTDNQDFPMDLSVKSSPRQVDFSISSLLKIPTA